jgi:nitrite reductase/ring-hydroxylating ferredoxin subunit
MVKVLVCKVSEVPSGKMVHANVNGKDVLIANVNGTYYAVSDICTHAGANLHEGKLDGVYITCPWHRAVWDVTNGQLVKFPVKLKPLEVYKVIVEDNNLYIDINK